MILNLKKLRKMKKPEALEYIKSKVQKNEIDMDLLSKASEYFIKKGYIYANGNLLTVTELINNVSNMAYSIIEKENIYYKKHKKYMNRFHINFINTGRLAVVPVDMHKHNIEIYIFISSL